jgi:hypothetical protein
MTDIVEMPDDFVVVANDPAAMKEAQASLILWTRRKIVATKAELAEANVNLDSAKAHKWATTGWDKQVKRLEKLFDFYKKIKAALEAGYYIVPPFPLETFAIRTNASRPSGRATGARWRGLHAQKSKLLPAGEGRYVSPNPKLKRIDSKVRKVDGSINDVVLFTPDQFQDAPFPFKLARAEIMEATRNAMSLKVFDQIGYLPGRKTADPIICGEILNPARPGQSVAFFVSWWLDTKTL